MGIGLNESCRKLHHSFRSWAPKMTLAEEKVLLDEGVTPQEVKRVKARHSEMDTPIVRAILVETRAKRKGFWGVCNDCKGEGEVANLNPAIVSMYAKVNLFETWEPTLPPSGVGWQLWEMEDDPSPHSPVFETPEELAKFCAKSLSGPVKDWLEWIQEEGYLEVVPVEPIFFTSLDGPMAKKKEYQLN